MEGRAERFLKSLMRRSFGVALLLAAAISAAARAPVAPDRIVLPSDVAPTHYDIDIIPDAGKLAFAGTVRIDIEVKRPTRSIVLNAVDLAFNKVALDSQSEVPAVSFDIGRQTATLTFASLVGRGRHVLVIAYQGKIYQQASGLFALDYATATDKKRALFTQFENSDARRFIPSWDEPAQKATFTLTATVPADEMPLSNMPVASTETLPGGKQRVHFAISPKMSCYLLYFGSGDFERIARDVNGIDVGVVVKRGDAEKAHYALDAAAHLLPYYENYFALKYPLPKLDLIAAPGASEFYGAMENWGAIFYFEKYLLVDPKISTQSDRRLVYSVVAHEMAHQWFGDLVTMAWWDDIWLNEGFASWMTLKAMDEAHPEWTPWMEGQDEKENAMHTDARRGTHPIIQPIRDVLQANQAFDEITYSKGEAVIRMLESYLGEASFRDGVRNYLKRHAYGNTVSDDLWRELDKTSSVPVTDIAHDFTLQAGVPLVRAAGSASGITLTQGRFSVDEKEKQPMHWRVPVVGLALGSTTPSHGILTQDKPMELAGSGGIVINEGQAGYFRTLYAPPLMRPLIAHFRELSAADELGLINDSCALGYAGYEPLSDFLALAQNADAGLDPTVLRTTIARLQDMDFLYQDLPGQAPFRAFARGLLHPILTSIGWTTRTQEPQNVTLLREVLLKALSEFDDEQVIAQARAYFADYVRNPVVLSVDLRRSVLAIVAMHADNASWEQLHVMANLATSTLEKQELYTLLGTVRDRDLAGRAMKLALTDEAIVTTRPEIVDRVSRWYPDLAFDFALAHLETLMALLEPDSRSQYLPQLVGNSYNAAMIAKLRAYVDAHVPADARAAAAKSEAQIAYKAGVRKQRLPDVDRWLTAHS